MQIIKINFTEYLIGTEKTVKIIILNKFNEVFTFNTIKF